MKTGVLTTSLWLSVLAAYLQLGEASLYPTRPISNTVFHAGKAETVKWIESDAKPTLKHTPPLRMDLYVAETKYLTTLAEGVDPLDLYHNVTIKSSLWSDASNFHIRFFAEEPETLIFTADFSVSGMDGSNGTASGSGSGSGSSNSDVYGLQGGANVSLVTATSTSTPSATFFDQANPSSKPNSEVSIGRRLTAERGAFRLVFVLWPALIGVALAL